MTARRIGACVVAALACVGGGQASAAVPAGNLLQNPGAEQGAVDATPTGWVATGGFRVRPYGPGAGAAFSATIAGGANFFGGGADDATSTGTQVVDVSSAAAEIDKGLVSAQLSGYLGGYDADQDSIRVTAGTQGLSQGPFVEAVAIGPVTAADRGNQQTLLPRSATAAIPPGTRRINVVATATRSPATYNTNQPYGTSNDGWADNLSLVLTARPAPATGNGGPTTPAKTRRKGSVRGIKSPGRRVKGRISVAAPCKSGRRVVVKKGSKTLGSARTKSSGRFNIKTKKHKKGKLTVKVRQRTVGNTVCGSLSKKVPGRN